MPFIKLEAMSGVEGQMKCHVRLCTEVFAFVLFSFDIQILEITVQRRTYQYKNSVQRILCIALAP